ncbi:MAG: MopE-related protein, partial [Myxococcota bacterium]
QREEPCAVGEDPVWVCNADLLGATCVCNTCPEDNSQGEVCDGRDNDCDGTTDNLDSAQLLAACGALEGAFATGCATGRCTYTCATGRGDADGDIQAGLEGNGCECVQSNGGVELCDGVDNDCNGVIDDLPASPLCARQQGVCAGATTACIDGVAVACSDEDYTNHGGELYEGIDALELACDGIDNNCDGRIDENCCDTDTHPFLNALTRTTLIPLPATLRTVDIASHGDN